MTSFPHLSAPGVDLKVPRRNAARAAYADLLDRSTNDINHRIAEDMEALRQREENLREYEARLRALQADVDLSRVPLRPAPAASLQPVADASLQGAWEKLHRARSLLEAEQSHLREDQLALKEERELLRRRQAELDLREARIAARETGSPQAGSVASTLDLPSEGQPGVMDRLTRAPFAMAKSVFGSKK